MHQKGRFIGLDYGAKRCGLAVSDPLAMIASPIEGVERKGLDAAMDRLVAEEPCAGLVVGMAVRLDGSMSEIEGEIQSWLNQLAKRWPQLQVFREDERHSSQQAVRSMLQAGASKSSRADKLKVDSVAAALILRGFLEGRVSGRT